MNSSGLSGVESIFSEDVKDPSMFLIESSDEDDDLPNEHTPATPKPPNHAARVENSTRDVFSDKLNRQTRLDDRLYEHELIASPILSEINKFFEESVASIAAEESKLTQTSNSSTVDLTNVEQNVEVIEDVQSVVIGPPKRSRRSINVNPQNPPKSKKRTRTRSRKLRFGEYIEYPGDSDEEYIPEGSHSAIKAKGKTQSRQRRSREDNNALQTDLFMEHVRLLEPYTEEETEWSERTRRRKTPRQTNTKGRNNKAQTAKTRNGNGTSISQIIQIAQGYNYNRLDDQRSGDKHIFDDEDHELVKRQDDAIAEETQTICLKFVILDENRTIIKDDRLQKVYVKRSETIGNLAAKFGKIFNLEEDKYNGITIYIDGDPQPHHITIGDERLGIEEGMQIDIKFPQKKIPNSQNEVYHDAQEKEYDLPSHNAQTVSMNPTFNANDQTNAEISSHEYEVIEID